VALNWLYNQVMGAITQHSQQQQHTGFDPNGLLGDVQGLFSQHAANTGQQILPASQDPYPVIDGIQKLVEQETAANAATAEAEWKETTSHYHAKTLSAVPGINVRPTGAGVELRVRYITRAYERHEARKRIYEAVVGMMHVRREAVQV